MNRKSSVKRSVDQASRDRIAVRYGGASERERAARRDRQSRRILVPERGLRNTRRNRRWVALVRMFSHQIPGVDQELCESLAWAAIGTYEGTP